MKYGFTLEIEDREQRKVKRGHSEKLCSPHVKMTLLARQDNTENDLISKQTSFAG